MQPLRGRPPGKSGANGIKKIDTQAPGAMKQRILGYRTPPCHRRPVIATQSSVLRIVQVPGGGGVLEEVASDAGQSPHTGRGRTR